MCGTNDVGIMGARNEGAHMLLQLVVIKLFAMLIPSMKRSVLSNTPYCPPSSQINMPLIIRGMLLDPRKTT